ncbi:TolC family protein [Halopseudomonas pachastrellae]|nr:TolC family protein [Halopseudomonas pachastrellae]
MQQIREGVVPDLTEALELTRDAYERGRYTYVEWISAQQELLSARQALVDAAATALLNQALLEQLTAQPLAAVQGASER